MKTKALAAASLAFAALALAGCTSAPAGTAPTESTAAAGSTIREVGPLDPACVADSVTGTQPALTSTTIVGAHATDALPTQARTAALIGDAADIYVESSPGKSPPRATSSRRACRGHPTGRPRCRDEYALLRSCRGDDPEPER